MNSLLFLLIASVAVVVRCSNVSCFSCVSTVDDDCDVNDVDRLRELDYLQPCEPIDLQSGDNIEAFGCRKIIQIVESEPMTIRECAYLDDGRDYYSKSGNWAIKKHYYQCTNDDEEEGACNSVSTITFFLTVFTAFVINFL